MSTPVLRSACKAVGSLIALSLVAAGCDLETEPVAPETTPIEAVAPDFSRLGHDRVRLCHRTWGRWRRYIPISVGPWAARAHLRHGDRRVGEPVPRQPGMVFDEHCRPTADSDDETRQVTSSTGSWDGVSYRFTGLFTVESLGPVDVSATVDAADPTWPLWAGLLGHDPEAPTPPGTCSTLHLPTPLPPGPSMSAPTVTAHWDEVPPGTYCLNVASAVPVPPYPPPYSWTATITHP